MLPGVYVGCCRVAVGAGEKDPMGRGLKVIATTGNKTASNDGGIIVDASCAVFRVVSCVFSAAVYLVKRPVDTLRIEDACEQFHANQVNSSLKYMQLSFFTLNRRQIPRAEAKSPWGLGPPLHGGPATMRRS